MKLDCEVVQTRDGTPAMRDRSTGELMHRTGPLLEGNRLYVGPARLEQRLRASGTEPLTLLDAGLGAGSNALAAWRCSAALTGARRRLRIVSLDRSASALELALQPENAASFGLLGGAADAARSLLQTGHHECSHYEWQLQLGEMPELLAQLAQASVDVVFWDPFSPRVNPELWSYAAFKAVRRACRAGATLHTYSGATAARAALLLAGFAVGVGEKISEGKYATCATTDPASLDQPLDRRWLERLSRSSAPLPSDAPPGALSAIGALRQFAL